MVEDDAMIGEAIRAGLKREGFAVDWVREGLAGERVLGTEPFDLLLLDLGLPGSDGLKLLKGLRARGESPARSHHHGARCGLRPRRGTGCGRR